MLVPQLQQVAVMIGLLESTKLLLEYVSSDDCAAEKALATLMCILLGRIWQHPDCTDQLRDHSFRLALEIFRLRREVLEALTRRRYADQGLGQKGGARAASHRPGA